MNLIEETMEAGTAVSAEQPKRPADELACVVAAVEEDGSQDAAIEAMTARIATLEETVAALAQRVETLEKAAVEHSAAKHVSAAAATTRKTLSAGTSTLLTKSGFGEGIEAGAPLAKIDAALTSLPIEQRIAVKAELMRAGLL